MDLANSQHPDRSTNAPSAEVSECWIYTPRRGLREVMLVNPDTTLTIDGERLRSWCVLDCTRTGSSLVVIYSAEAPSAEVRRAATRLARERFEHRAWFAASQGLTTYTADAALTPH